MNLLKLIQSKLDDNILEFSIDNIKLFDIMVAVNHLKSDWNIYLDIKSSFYHRSTNWYTGIKRKELTNCHFRFVEKE